MADTKFVKEDDLFLESGPFSIKRLVILQHPRLCQASRHGFR